MKNIRTATVMMLLMFGTSTWAGTFCVANSTMLETVLDITESNGQDDVIKIKTGTYVPLNDYGFRFYLGENHDIEISGSWDNDCAEQSLNPLDTVLDGDNSKQVISFYTNQNSPNITATISMSVLSVNNGLYHEQGTTIHTTSGLGFDLSFSGDSIIYLDRLVFMGNRSNNSSALRAQGGKFTIKNSVFFNNESDYGTISSVADAFYFINNTVVNNTYYDQFNNGSSRTGLSVSQYTVAALIANNIFWSNYGDDVDGFTNSQGDPVFYLYNNDYQSVNGTFDYISGNISADPQLGFLNFTPDISSPVVDKGHHLPAIIPFPPPFQYDWSFGDWDFLSADRVVNNRVDIGAIEAAAEVPIFINSFEQTRGG